MLEALARNIAPIAHTAGQAAQQQATDAAVDDREHTKLTQAQEAQPQAAEVPVFLWLASQVQAEERAGRPLTTWWIC